MFSQNIIKIQWYVVIFKQTKASKIYYLGDIFFLEKFYTFPKIKCRSSCVVILKLIAVCCAERWYPSCHLKVQGEAKWSVLQQVRWGSYLASYSTNHCTTEKKKYIYIKNQSCVLRKVPTRLSKVWNFWKICFKMSLFGKV